MHCVCAPWCLILANVDRFSTFFFTNWFAFQSSHSVPGVCKQHETEKSSVCSWIKQSNARVSSRSEPIPSTGCSNRESPVTNLPTRSWYDQVTVTRRTQRRPWRNVRGGHQQAGKWQCNWRRAQRTSCAQAGTAGTVFSLWSLWPMQLPQSRSDMHNAKNAIFSKTKQFTAMLSIDYL